MDFTDPKDCALDLRKFCKSGSLFKVKNKIL